MGGVLVTEVAGFMLTGGGVYGYRGRVLWLMVNEGGACGYWKRVYHYLLRKVPGYQG